MLGPSRTICFLFLKIHLILLRTGFLSALSATTVAEVLPFGAIKNIEDFFGFDQKMFGLMERQCCRAAGLLQGQDQGECIHYSLQYRLLQMENNKDKYTCRSKSRSFVIRRVSPIALDMNNSSTVERIKGFFSFDFSGTGEQVNVSEWFAPYEGILVDTRIFGEISGEHLFGDLGGRFSDGFAKLAEWDFNNDGHVRGSELNHLGIWLDKNSNAKLEYGELTTLIDHNIIGLSTQHKAYFSQAQLTRGQTMLMEDVWFPVAPTYPVDSEIETEFKQSLLFTWLFVIGFIGSVIGLASILKIKGRG